VAHTPRPTAANSGIYTPCAAKMVSSTHAEVFQLDAPEKPGLRSAPAALAARQPATEEEGPWR
jgi:hypothetical protein